MTVVGPPLLLLLTSLYNITKAHLEDETDTTPLTSHLIAFLAACVAHMMVFNSAVRHLSA